MKGMISTLSLALSLAVATPALAQSAPTAASAAAPTAADADAFIAGVEKALFDYSVEARQVNWVNSTYITEDNNALHAVTSADGIAKHAKYTAAHSTTINDREVTATQDEKHP